MLSGKLTKNLVRTLGPGRHGAIKYVTLIGLGRLGAHLC